MSNLPVLYVTLGALVGLPWGYHSARVWYEELRPLLFPMVGVWAAYCAVSRDCESLIFEWESART